MFIGEIWLRSFQDCQKFLFYNAFFSLRIKLCCFLYLITSFENIFWLTYIALIFNWKQFIIAECSVSLTWCLWLPRRIFLIFGACLSKTSTKFFFKVQYPYELRELGLLLNSDWKSVSVNFLTTVNEYFWFLFLECCLQYWLHKVMMVA